MSESKKLTPAQREFFKAVSAGDPAEVSRLLAAVPELVRAVNFEAGPDYVHDSDGKGCGPLHFAGSTAVIDLLLDGGADLEARDLGHHSTPLQYLSVPRPALARHLLDRGAGPDVFSLVAAGTPNELRNWIREHPGSLHARIDRATFPPGPGGAVNILNITIGCDCTLLHAAATVDRPGMIETLLGLGLDINQRGAYDECTALHSAAWHNRIAAAAALLDHGARLDIVSGPQHENTPLGWAIVAGHWEMVEFLIERGARPQRWFVHDAEIALAGAFRDIAPEARQSDRERILDRIRSFAGALSLNARPRAADGIQPAENGDPWSAQR